MNRPVGTALLLALVIGVAAAGCSKEQDSALGVSSDRAPHDFLHPLRQDRHDS